jgi:tRNA pseudouridine38-40 synthase
VHALGQCAHADVLADKLNASEWLQALNATLPPTVRILRARFVSNQFHARFSARAKLYRYRIVNGAVLSPFENGRAWHVTRPLDFTVLNTAARLFAGLHDFAGFSANRGKPETNTVRMIESARVRRGGELVTVEFWGNGFLYKMVRMMVGAMVRCALGKEQPEAIREQLRNPGGKRRAFVAPAPGLYLVRIRY